LKQACGRGIHPQTAVGYSSGSRVWRGRVGFTFVNPQERSSVPASADPETSQIGGVGMFPCPGGRGQVGGDRLHHHLYIRGLCKDGLLELSQWRSRPTIALSFLVFSAKTPEYRLSSPYQHLPDNCNETIAPSCWNC